ncbi:TraR/DksA C4-type zinc finger protein [bacterium]|nr:TraR/DksA C4-type zinc finger protein [bacterium]
MESYRKQLLALQKEILASELGAREGAQPVELDQSRVGRLSRMEAMQAQAVALESRRRRQLKSQQIKIALQKIDAGTFGLCSRCDEEIDKRRLDFDPATPMCISCAQSMEK